MRCIRFVLYFDRIMGSLRVPVKRLPLALISKLQYSLDSEPTVLRPLVLVYQSANKFLYVLPMKHSKPISCIISLYHILFIK